MSYIKQNKKRIQTLDSAQYGMEIIFKSLVESNRMFFPV